MHGHIQTRWHKIFNSAGMIAIGLFVVFGTIILVLVAKGYNFDFKTQEIVQNGLILIGSEPVPADVYLDGESRRDTTPHRITLPAGNYTVELKEPGYRDWKRNFDLIAGEVLWLSYPLLIPERLTSLELMKISEPRVVEASPDSSLVAAASGQTVRVFDSDDTAVQNAFTVDLTAGVGGLPGSVTSLVWADDNEFALVTVSDGTATRRILTRLDPNPTFADVTEKLSGYSEIKFVPKQNDEWYGLKDRALWRLGLEAPPERLVERVDRYSAFETAVLSWSSDSKRVILHQERSSTVLDIAAIENIHDLSLSKFEGRLIAAVSADNVGTIIVVEPGDSDQKVIAHKRLGSRLIFSPGANYLMSYRGNEVQVYDFERERFYTYQLPSSSVSNVRWGTGAQLVAIADGASAVMFDFDGSNYQTLGNSLEGTIILSPNKEHVVHIAASEVDGQPILQDIVLAP